jgi:hypothetical protein
MKATYSSYIHLLIHILKHLFPELEIIEYAKLPAKTAGRCSYKECWIKIDESNACKALMTIAHEGGHYLSYIRNKYRACENFEEFFTQSERERLAYLYGWALLKLIGADSLINKNMWKEFNNL